ncbi:MAG TPA: uroporphyrinogen decarboxylase family protein [Candidatus Eremiobacteraeota bacterium]|nr:MAG: methylcobalamin:coenzyme M methyltransferase [bacterium ADurb.Bin363]HPZ08216.1 uroporphyrinogen decarboxylase family protein [Candidatus Eremiobacteraeota bacterium]
MKMTKKERILATLEGEKTDRIPASFWRHFYEYETGAESLADIMIRYEREMDWDFMKVNARASYHDEAWGCKYEFYKDGFRKPKKLYHPVKSIDDYNEIVVLDPLKSPPLREQIDALHLIGKALRDDLFFVMTVFTPFSIVAELVESFDTIKEHIRNHPDLIHRVLDKITSTFEKFIEEALNTGISGLFYATRHWASNDYFTPEEFLEFCRPYDMRLLEKVKSCPLNILHICKSNNMLSHLSDYPVHAFHWDSCDPTNMSLQEGKKNVTGAVIGGINQKTTILKGSVEECLKEARIALNLTGRHRWLLSAGCTYPPETPIENLRALREWT